VPAESRPWPRSPGLTRGVPARGARCPRSEAAPISPLPSARSSQPGRPTRGPRRQKSACIPAAPWYKGRYLHR
jgi:hypothetical protein